MYQQIKCQLHVTAVDRIVPQITDRNLQRCWPDVATQHRVVASFNTAGSVALAVIPDHRRDLWMWIKAAQRRAVVIQGRFCQQQPVVVEDAPALDEPFGFKAARVVCALLQVVAADYAPVTRHHADDQERDQDAQRNVAKFLHVGSSSSGTGGADNIRKMPSRVKLISSELPP